jgi:hypothetical protein
VLLELFKLVDFHPLSIGLLTRQLKMHRPAELGQRLEALIAETPGNPLLASLNLSLERLDAEAMQLLPRLGVFQGGAMEPELRKYGRLIVDVVAAVDDTEVRQQLKAAMEELVKNGWHNLVAAIHRILDGERDEEVLCEPLNYEEAPIIYAILQGIADPQTLEALLE